jgi:hypothetical protein
MNGFEFRVMSFELAGIRIGFNSKHQTRNPKRIHPFFCIAASTRFGVNGPSFKRAPTAS